MVERTVLSCTDGAKKKNSLSCHKEIFFHQEGTMKKGLQTSEGVLRKFYERLSALTACFYLKIKLVKILQKL